MTDEHYQCRGCGGICAISVYVRMGEKASDHPAAPDVFWCHLCVALPSLFAVGTKINRRRVEPLSCRSPSRWLASTPPCWNRTCLCPLEEAAAPRLAPRFFF